MGTLKIVNTGNNNGQSNAKAKANGSIQPNEVNGVHFSKTNLYLQTMNGEANEAHAGILEFAENKAKELKLKPDDKGIIEVEVTIEQPQKYVVRLYGEAKPLDKSNFVAMS